MDIGTQLAKRRSALLESNRPRNSQPETHSDAGLGVTLESLPALRFALPRNRFPHAFHNADPCPEPLPSRLANNLRTPPAVGNLVPSEVASGCMSSRKRPMEDRASARSRYSCR